MKVIKTKGNEQLVASNRTVPLSFSSLSCITAHRRSSSTLQRTSQQYLKSEDSEEVGGAAMDVDMDVAEMGLDAGDPHPLEKLADSDFFNNPKRASAPYSQARQRVPQPQKRRRALLPNAPLLHELLLLLLTAPTAAPTPTAAALGASESAAALGAGEFAAAPGAIESAAALGARVSTATGPSSAEALYPFTLDSGASRSFFRDCTTLTPLAAPIPVSLADPTGGPVVARASSVLPCPAVPSGSLSGLHLPTFSTNLESNAAILDVWVDTFIPGGQRVAICTRSRTGRHLATFTRRPRSNLYTLTTSSAQVAEAGQVVASSQVSTSGHLATSCSCRVLSHQNLLWHHRLGNPSLPRLRSMHSRLLVSGLPRSLPSLPCSPAPPCLLCAEGRQLAAPHSSEFFPTTAPLQTLHMDIP
ncbi:unnamed protein product [Closterium sp. NIES-53]